MQKFKLTMYSVYQYLRHLFSRKRIIMYIGGYPNISNVGDVALFNAYEKLFIGHPIIHFRGGRIESFLYSIYKKADIVPLLAGGTLINHMCLREAKKGKEIFGPLYVLGTGVAQTSYWANREGYSLQETEWKEVLKDSPFIGVRGPLSMEQLTKIGISSKVIGDPVLYLSRPLERSLSDNNLTVGLNVGSSLGNVQGGEENLKRFFQELAQTLKDRGYQIIWFVVCPEDLTITEEIARLTDTKTIEKVYLSYEEYFNKVHGCDLFVGTKLHSICLALCVSVPSIMIEYRPKCRDFMMSLELDNYSVTTESCNTENLMNVLDNIKTNYSSYVKNLNSHLAHYQKILKTSAEAIIKKEDD